MKRITVDLEDDLYERLRAEAYARHVPMSEIVRDRLASSLPRLPQQDDNRKEG
jgi:predicted transcriptional regulator